MSDRDPIQGFDCSTTVIGPNGPELVGEFQETEFSIKNETEDYLEQNERIAKILDGEIKIEGKLKKGFMNLDIIKTCYGSGSLKRGTRIPKSPRFTITTNIKAPEKGYNGKYRLIDCVIPELSVAIQAGKSVVKSDLSFKAEGIEEA
ncbi:hypothetical protein SDC9_199582 [bioreactor metagenome]|uniref:Uncharacterized protein n=1 Tax=bioreactor metagenome TaxID=1076179 RepID=A0A645IKW5_9ZZZZ